MRARGRGQDAASPDDTLILISSSLVSAALIRTCHIRSFCARSSTAAASPLAARPSSRALPAPLCLRPGRVLRCQGRTRMPLVYCSDLGAPAWVSFARIVPQSRSSKLVPAVHAA